MDKGYLPIMEELQRENRELREEVKRLRRELEEEESKLSELQEEIQELKEQNQNLRHAIFGSKSSRKRSGSNASQKQKCRAHLLRDARELVDKKQPPPESAEFYEGLL